MKKRITTNKIALSLSVFLFMLYCFLFVFNFLKANAEEVFLTDEIAVSDFCEDDFDYYSGERKSFAFLNEEKDYEATLISEEALQGNYSVSFSVNVLVRKRVAVGKTASFFRNNVRCFANYK